MTESHADYFDLIWICSSSSSSNKFETYCVLSTREASHQTCSCSWQKAGWQPADWFCALHILFPLCMPVLGIFLLNDFFLSAILWTCRHTAYEGPYFKAACISFRRLKLVNTCSMNYITVPHMDSPLQKHTHLAGMSILTLQMETNHPLSYLTPPLLAFSSLWTELG